MLDFVRLTRAHLKLILVMLVIGIALAAAYTWTRPVLYTSVATGQVHAGASTSTGEALSSLSLAVSESQVYAAYVNSQAVRDKIAARIHSAGDVVPAYTLTATTDNVSPQIKLSATTSSPAMARDVADAAVRALAEVVADQEQQSIAQEKGAKGATSVVRVVPLDDAVLPTSPSSPNYRRNLLGGALLGLVLGYVAAIARRSLDRRVRYVADVEELVGKAVLAVIPQMRSLNRQQHGGVDKSARGPGVEALRQLRTNLRFVDVDRPPRSVVVTSANPGEGKSTVSANLARLLAAAGQPTLLVDADLRRPMIASLFGADAQAGLTQVLAGDLTMDDALLTTSETNLYLLPSGRIPPNPSELLGSQRMSHLLKELSKHYLIVIDAPPLLPVADAGLLSGQVDGTLLVLAVGSTYKEQARLAAQRLNQVGGHLLGVVVNKAPMKGLASVIYGYGYGYGHYASSYNYYGAPGNRRGTRRGLFSFLRRGR
ncbi:polysaccharide biosynthesis tyrosine autokinase [Nocardioides montaniterrae]